MYMVQVGGRKMNTWLSVTDEYKYCECVRTRVYLVCLSI